MVLVLTNAYGIIKRESQHKMNPNQYPPQSGQPGPYPPNYGGSSMPPNPYAQPAPNPYATPPNPYAQPAPYGPPPTQSQYGPPAGAMPPYGAPQNPVPPGYLQPNPFATPGVDPYDTATRKKPGVGPLPFVIGGVVLLIIIIAVVAATSGSNSGNTSNQQQQQQSNENTGLPDVISRPDGELDLSKTLDTSKSLKSQTVQAKIKEQVNLSSGFSFLAKEIGEYESTTTPPAAGKKFVIVQVSVGNRAAAKDDAEDLADGISVSYLDFKLRDSGNKLLSGHPLTQQIINNPLSSPLVLKTGEQVVGRLIFEVAVAENEWELTHKETYQKTSDNTTFTVEGRIALELEEAEQTEPAGTTPPAAAPATPPATPATGQ